MTPRTAIRVMIPQHLANLARCDTTVAVAAEPTVRAVLDALEATFPALRGTIRDRNTGQRRPYIRYFGCEADLSFADPEASLPAPIAAGNEPLLIVGAMAGG